MNGDAALGPAHVERAYREILDEAPLMLARGQSLVEEFRKRLLGYEMNIAMLEKSMLKGVTIGIRIGNNGQHTLPSSIQRLQLTPQHSGLKSSPWKHYADPYESIFWILLLRRLVGRVPETNDWDLNLADEYVATLSPAAEPMSWIDFSDGKIFGGIETTDSSAELSSDQKAACDLVGFEYVSDHAVNGMNDKKNAADDKVTRSPNCLILHSTQRKRFSQEEILLSSSSGYSGPVQETIERLMIGAAPPHLTSTPTTPSQMTAEEKTQLRKDKKCGDTEWRRRTAQERYERRKAAVQVGPNCPPEDSSSPFLPGHIYIYGDWLATTSPQGLGKSILSHTGKIFAHIMAIQCTSGSFDFVRILLKGKVKDSALNRPIEVHFERVQKSGNVTVLPGYEIEITPDRLRGVCVQTDQYWMEKDCVVLPEQVDIAVEWKCDRTPPVSTVQAALSALSAFEERLHQIDQADRLAQAGFPTLDHDSGRRASGTHRIHDVEPRARSEMNGDGVLGPAHAKRAYQEVLADSPRLISAGACLVEEYRRQVLDLEMNFGMLERLIQGGFSTGLRIASGHQHSLPSSIRKMQVLPRHPGKIKRNWKHVANVYEPKAVIRSMVYDLASRDLRTVKTECSLQSMQRSRKPESNWGNGSHSSSARGMRRGTTSPSIMGRYPLRVESTAPTDE